MKFIDSPAAVSFAKLFPLTKPLDVATDIAGKAGEEETSQKTCQTTHIIQAEARPRLMLSRKGR